MKKLEGFIASVGISCGSAYLYKKVVFDYSKKENLSKKKRAIEIKRFRDAVDFSKKELAEIKKRYMDKGEKELAHIFRSQLTILEDEELLSNIEKRINNKGENAEYAVSRVIEDYKRLFEELEEGSYVRERKKDLEDVSSRIIKNLLNINLSSLKNLPDDCIIVAIELFPSDTAEMDISKVKGIITERGGVTSHVSIIAKSLGIPALVGVKGATSLIGNGDYVCIYSVGLDKGEVYINPDEKIKEKMKSKSVHFLRYRKDLEKVKNLEPVTKDGERIIVSANIGSVEDFHKLAKEGINSVGLFRTEFLFLNSKKLPDEETQFEIYKEIAERLKPGMVVIRTLDIGGDKNISALVLPEEENPFLGLRGIRVGFKYPEILEIQLRAIIRASVYGNVKVMFPMISDIVEIRRVKDLISRIKSDLERDGYRYNKNMEIGIMVEVPATALVSDMIVNEVDFFSIGTNDLVQYLLAADRLNENVREYYKQFHPAVFRIIKMIVNSAKNGGKWVGVCGELGGNVFAIPILIGLGVSELSVESTLMPNIIDIIRSITLAEAKMIADDILKMVTDEDIIEYMKNKLSFFGKDIYL